MLDSKIEVVPQSNLFIFCISIYTRGVILILINLLFKLYDSVKRHRSVE